MCVEANERWHQLTSLPIRYRKSLDTCTHGHPLGQMKHNGVAAALSPRRFLDRDDHVRSAFTVCVFCARSAVRTSQTRADTNIISRDLEDPYQKPHSTLGLVEARLVRPEAGRRCVVVTTVQICNHNPSVVFMIQGLTKKCVWQNNSCMLLWKLPPTHKRRY